MGAILLMYSLSAMMFLYEIFIPQVLQVFLCVCYPVSQGQLSGNLMQICILFYYCLTFQMFSQNIKFKNNAVWKFLEIIFHKSV